MLASVLGRATPVGKLWWMMKRMSGVRREWDYPVLTSGEDMAVTDEEKAEMMAKAFVKVPSLATFSEDGERENERGAPWSAGKEEGCKLRIEYTIYIWQR
jgi:hypothetical protein